MNNIIFLFIITIEPKFTLWSSKFESRILKMLEERPGLLFSAVIIYLMIRFGV